MPTSPAPRLFATPARRLATCVALVLTGVLAGALLTRPFRDPHTASAERLTGTVSWSNQQTRTIAFQVDGEPQAFYHVIADDLNFPSCLAGTAADPVRQDRRRVELEAVHQSFDGPQRVHFAVSVRCLG